MHLTFKTALIALAVVGSIAPAVAQDAMAKKDSMSKHGSMSKGEATSKHGSMGKDGAMSKHDSMGKHDSTSKDAMSK